MLADEAVRKRSDSQVAASLFAKAANGDYHTGVGECEKSNDIDLDEGAHVRGMMLAAGLERKEKRNHVTIRSPSCFRSSPLAASRYACNLVDGSAARAGNSS